MRSSNKRAALAILLLAAAWSGTGAGQSSGAVIDGSAIPGAPYNIVGTTYVPTDPAYYDEVGYAALADGAGKDGATVTGEPFAPESITGAHKTLPLPSYVEVTALDTGRTILVRINRRGPMVNDRLIALSPGAATQLGIEEGAAVRVRRVTPPVQERAVLRSGGRVAERLPAPAALLKALRAKLPQAPAQAATPPPRAAEEARIVAPRPGASFDQPSQPSPSPLRKAPQKAIAAAVSSPKTSAENARYFVQFGAFSSQTRARALADRVGARVEKAGALWRVRSGPFATRQAAQAELRAAAAKGVENGSVIPHDGR